jgi:hypothetical protein
MHANVHTWVCLGTFYFSTHAHVDICINYYKIFLYVVTSHGEHCQGFIDHPMYVIKDIHRYVCMFMQVHICLCMYYLCFNALTKVCICPCMCT